MLKDILQGRPIGHPLHPAIIHIPIALLTISVVFDVISLLGGGNVMVRGAYYTLLAGVITGVLASIPGFVDWTDIRADHPARKTANWHMILNLVSIALFAVGIGLRTGELGWERTPGGPLLVSLVAYAILGVSGYLGGTMVFDEGVGVGRHRRRTDLPPRTCQPEGEPANEGFVSVANADALAEDGQTLRAQVNGVAMALVKTDGQVYAVQDFCTHRFAPLSEGAVRDGQLECPWHRSCFDVRNGQVIEGPAKEPLRTFPVRIEDGKIMVKVEFTG